MDKLSPNQIPLYETDGERVTIWKQCIDRNLPVIAIRNGQRGYIVRYDIQHFEHQLGEQVVRTLRETIRDWRAYPTGTDPISETESVGGEVGPISGDLHTETETQARELAAHLSRTVLENTPFSQ